MKHQLFSIGKRTVSLLYMVILASCATIMGQSSPETLNIRSAPDQPMLLSLMK